MTNQVLIYLHIQKRPLLTAGNIILQMAQKLFEHNTHYNDHGSHG